MKRKGILIITLVSGFILWFILKPKYEYETFYSPYSSASITRIDYRRIFKKRTAFVYGKQDGIKMPREKLEPKYRGGLTDGFCAILEWRNDTAYIYAVDGRFENTLKNSKIIFCKLDGHNETQMKKWQEMGNSDSSRYIRFFQK